MTTSRTNPETILEFWFEEIEPKQWWMKSAEFDRLIESRFGEVHRAATLCELFSWRETADGRLAEVLVLDQFSRNIFRDRPESFACDALALALAQTAIATRADQELDAQKRTFLYMPFMHSESALIHAEAVALFSAPGMEFNLDFELRHKAIVDCFGRYPHRNAILGRASSKEEVEFLKTAGSSF